MSKIRKNYNKQQKLEIVKQSLEEGVSVKSIAKRIDISVNLIYNWRSKYLKYKDDSFSGQGIKTMTVEQQEIERLRKELKEAELFT